MTSVSKKNVHRSTWYELIGLEWSVSVNLKVTFIDNMLLHFKRKGHLTISYNTYFIKAWPKMCVFVKLLMFMTGLEEGIKDVNT